MKEVLYGDRPPLPLAVRLMNGMDRLGKALISLEPDGLLAAARKKAGLNDYGDQAFRQGLDRLVESLERDAALTTLGRLTARASLLQSLENRLRVIDHFKRFPETAREEIKRPLFIIGLPRSGTTILQALLDQDPANRSLLSWEALSPCPPPRPETYRTDPRIGRIQRQFDRLYQLLPGFRAVHPMSSDMPQECVTLFCMEFMSQLFFVQFDVSGYQEWLDDVDMGHVYAAHRRSLQLLQSGGVRGRRWLLKSPGHIDRITSLLDVYPDAAIIQTHRDPATVITSLASLTCMLRSIGSDRVDPKRIARRYIAWYEKLLTRSMAQRKALDGRAAQFFDLTQAEIARDPLGSVERIYRHFGFELSDDVRRRMEGFMRDNPREKHGDHRYRAEDFGIDPAAERRRFAGYMEYFNIGNGRMS